MLKYIKGLLAESRKSISPDSECNWLSCGLCDLSVLFGERSLAEDLLTQQAVQVILTITKICAWFHLIKIRFKSIHCIATDTLSL